MNGTKVTLNSEPNGSISITNDRSSITIQPDGTIAISSMDPVQLTGACQAKLDNSNIPRLAMVEFFAALAKRIDKKR